MLCSLQACKLNVCTIRNIKFYAIYLLYTQYNANIQVYYRRVNSMNVQFYVYTYPVSEPLKIYFQDNNFAIEHFIHYAILHKLNCIFAMLHYRCSHNVMQ